jgi:uncharacterized protein (DUF488 family)
MIFTLGYSNRTLPEFLGELDRRSITQIIDVRSSPWSRNAAFNSPQIEKWSGSHGIMFRQWGDVLGGRADIALDDPRYIERLEQIIDAARRERIAIFCAEGDPAACHRSWDIGASLLIRYGVLALSICRDGREEDIADTLARVRQSDFRGEMRTALSTQAELF